MGGFINAGSLGSMAAAVLAGRHLMPSEVIITTAPQPRIAARRKWRHRSVLFAPNGDRECERRRRQHALANQGDSHKPGTVQPRHIFGGA